MRQPWRWPLWLLVASFIAATAAVGQAPGAADEEQPRVTIAFRKTDIRDAAKALTEQTGVELILADDVQGALTANFEDRPLDQVLKLIAIVMKLEIEPVGHAFLLQRRPTETIAGADDGRPAQAGPPRVTISFQNTPIREAMQRLSQATGIDFIVANGIRGSITADFVDQPIDQVLKRFADLLGAEVELVEDVFVIRPPRAAGEAAVEPLPVREGAGALLPGAPPQGVLKEAGDEPAPLIGAPGETPETKPRERRKETATIPIENRSPRTIAGLLGAGYIDSQGVYHAPGAGAAGAGAAGPAGAVDPYRNLPPRARVTRNGTILLPNGTTILPSGVVIGPDGTVYPPRQVPYITVPYGAPLPQTGVTYQDPNRPVVGGNIRGVPFQVGANGGVSVRPPTVNVGGAQVQLPGVSINPNGTQQQGQVVPQTQGPTIYYGQNAPRVHYGERPTDWYYGLPPGWHYTPPQGAPVHPGFTPPRGPGARLPTRPTKTDEE